VRSLAACYGGVAIVDRTLYIPRKSGGVMTVPSFERLKALAKKWWDASPMAQLGNASETNLLKLFFQNVAWANVGNAGGLQPSTVAGSIFVALHTATPGAGGTQSTNEATYGNYARVGVARSSGGWTVTGSSPATAENAAAVTFAQSSATNTPETESFFSTGLLTSGAGDLAWFGGLNANLIVNNLITPSFAINALTDTIL
jgi:hypothetical protein